MEAMMRSISGSNKEGHNDDHHTNTMDLEDDTYSFNIEWLNSKKFIKQLEKDNIDVEMLREELSRKNLRKRHFTWKEKALQIIKGNFVQVVLCLLILIDAGIVITEIILEIHSMKSKKEFYEEQSNGIRAFITKKFNYYLLSSNDTESHGIVPGSVKNASSSVPAHDLIGWCNRTFVKSIISANKTDTAKTHVHSVVVSSGHHPDTEGRGSEKGDILHTVGLYLHYISIAVLVVFMMELMLRIICIGERFFKKKAEMFDGVIIVTSLLADIIFVHMDSPEISAMVVFLLWRIVRLINGLMMHEKQRDEFRITLQKKTRRVCQMKVNRLSTEKELLTKHVVSLEELCREFGANDDQLKNCKPRFKKYSKEQTNNALKSIAALTTGFMGGMIGAPSSNHSAINRFSGTSPSPSIQSPNNSRKLKIMRKISETPYSSFENSENEMTPMISHSLFIPCTDSPMASVDRESPFRFTIHNLKREVKSRHPHDEKQGEEAEDTTNPHLLDISVIHRQSTKSSIDDQDKSHDKDSNTVANSRGYGSSVSPSTSISEPNEVDVDDNKPSLRYSFTQAERCRTFRERFRSQDVIKTQESSLDSPPSVDEGIESAPSSQFPIVATSK